MYEEGLLSDVHHQRNCPGFIGMQSVWNELKMEAFEKGANAVVAIKLDFDEYSEGMLMLTVSGTAVVLE